MTLLSPLFEAVSLNYENDLIIKKKEVIKQDTVRFIFI